MLFLQSQLITILTYCAFYESANELTESWQAFYESFFLFWYNSALRYIIMGDKNEKEAQGAIVTCMLAVSSPANIAN